MTHTVWLVAREALNERVVAEHGIILPETLVDGEALPHAHRWQREQPLVCLSGLGFQSVADSGLRVFRIAFDATGDERLHVEELGGALGATSLTVSLKALSHAADVARRGLSQVDFGGSPSPIDRLLRLLSGGSLDEASVMNAIDARSLIEDGYGYRGALEGRYRSLDVIARQLRPVDELFGQVFARASQMSAIAEGLQRAAELAEPDQSEVSVPLYGTARYVVEAALSVPSVDRFVFAGRPTRDLHLPAERRLMVGHVEPWSPRLTEHLSLVTDP